MRRLATALTLLAVLVAGCGDDSGAGSGDLRKRVEARFAKEGVELYEVAGFYEGGPDLQLAPKSRDVFGDFTVHIILEPRGLEVAEAGTAEPDADGIRWDDALAGHNPPYYKAVRPYGDKLVLQWSTEKRSVDQEQWRKLDAIMQELQE